MAKPKQKRLQAGKLPHALLGDFLKKLPIKNERLLVGPAVGVDAAAIRVEAGVLLAKSDPITFTDREQGRFAVQVNANDIACMGGVPKWFLATILLPDQQDGQAEHLMALADDLSEACHEIGVTIVGGHTEVTPAVNQPLIAGTMLGEVRRDRLLNIRHCQPHDRVLLVSGIAIEATAIIARHCEAELAEIFDRELIERCKNFTRDPGISVLKAAQLAAESTLARAMHDPTEGGIYTALHEIADAAGCGLEVAADLIFSPPESRLLCEFFNLDMFGVISSGALLVVAAPEHSETLLHRFEQRGLPAADIGFLTDQPARRVVVADKSAITLPRFDQDEITKIFMR